MSEININSTAQQLVEAVNNSNSVGGLRRLYRVCSYNIGHFALGKNPESWTSSDNQDYGIEMYKADRTNYPKPRSNYEVQLKRWKHRLADIGADIICTPEYNKWFGNLNGTNIEARDVIFGDYPYYYAPNEAHTNDYHREAIFTMINHASQEVIQLTDYLMMNEPQTAVIISFNIGSGNKMKTVYVCCTHLFWGGGDMATARTTAMQMLIQKFANASHVIICGDFNVTAVDEFNAFLNAGYDALNTSEHTLYTYGALGCGDSGDEFMPNRPLDNIIVKGFSVASSRVVNDPLITDHCGLVADLMIEEGGTA